LSTVNQFRRPIVDGGTIPILRSRRSIHGAVLVGVVNQTTTVCCFETAVFQATDSYERPCKIFSKILNKTGSEKKKRTVFNNVYEDTNQTIIDDLFTALSKTLLVFLWHALSILN